jgi:diadenosine tetraphosphate (Ap4A) HIT family hydrolase
MTAMVSRAAWRSGNRAVRRVLWVLLAVPLAAVDCACDPQKPETLEIRQCSLCREAERQPADVHVFFLKDINPRKPNRWLALPRAHGSAAHHLHDLPKAERTRLWTAAIAKAKEMWGDEDWGLAYNGEKVRTQCHLHVHIGKLLKGVERDINFIVVDQPSEIPAPKGEGLWVHPHGGRLHVHLGEQTCETVLLR